MTSAAVRVELLFTTNDMSLSAYLVMNNVHLIGARRLGKSFQFRFENDPRIEQLKVAYVNSESSRFDDAVRKLKAILYGSQTEES